MRWPIGGALGGVFNSLLAPLLFKSVIEYPIALACGILLLTFTSGTQPLLSRKRWWVEPAIGGGADDRRAEMARHRRSGSP